MVGVVTAPAPSTSAPSVLWQPQPGPQEWLLSCPVPEVFFGGARGGGKTDACIGDWLRCVAAYGAEAQGVWFRRSLPEIEGAALRMDHLFPRLGAVFEAQRKTWTWPNGAKLRLRYLERDRDADRYQGHAYTWLCFDEAGTWSTPVAIDALRGTLRSAAGVPSRLLLTGNPGGVGHAWLKARYVDSAPALTPHGKPARIYIPSRLADNPALALADPGYVDRLRATGKPARVRAWLAGDWSANLDGDTFKLDWFGRYATAPATFDRIVVSVDTGTQPGERNDPTVALILGEAGRSLFVLDVYRRRITHLERVDAMHMHADRWAPVAPTSVVIENKGSGQDTAQHLESDKARPFRHNLVKWTPHGSKELRAEAEASTVQAGRVFLPYNAPWLSDFEAEIATFPDSAHDDQVDALTQGLAFVRANPFRRGVPATCQW